MKLASFLRGGQPGFGCVEGGFIRDFSPYAKPGSTLRDYLPGGLEAWSALADAVTARDLIPLEEVRLLAPIPNARKYLGLGGNYTTHVAEAERLDIHRPTSQIWFNKQVSCIHGPYEAVEAPLVSEQLDYEGELGFVIARDCRHVAAEDAWSVVAGYVVCNDFSVRDWQLRAPTHTLGKSFDTHGPFGPWLVTADELPDPHALALHVTVNGEVRQAANTREMIHRIPAMIEELSTSFTLQAGDVFATGTPGGVGALSNPPRYLRPGDKVRVEIEAIGHIENVIVAEQRPRARNVPGARPPPSR